MGEGALSSVNLTIGVFLIDLLLSGDNAILIAMACRNLPAAQRRQAVWIGVGGAFGLRLLLTSVASLLLVVPGLRLLGGVLLLCIAIQLLIDDHGEDPMATGDAVDDGVTKSDLLMRAVKTIIVADAIMSLDNVLALSAYAHDNLAMLAFGLLLSMPLLMLGSVYLSTLIEEAAYIVWIGGGFLGWIAGDLIASEPLFRDFVEVQSPGLKVALPLISAVYVVLQSRIILSRSDRVDALRPTTPFLAGLLRQTAPHEPIQTLSVSEAVRPSTTPLAEQIQGTPVATVLPPEPPPQPPSTAVEPAASQPTVRPVAAEPAGRVRVWLIRAVAAIVIGLLLTLFGTVIFGSGWLPAPEDSRNYVCKQPEARISYSPKAGKLSISTATGYTRGKARDNKIDWDNYRASGKAIGFPPPTDIVDSKPDQLVLNGGMFVNSVCLKATK